MQMLNNSPLTGIKIIFYIIYIIIFYSITTPFIWKAIEISITNPELEFMIKGTYFLVIIITIGIIPLINILGQNLSLTNTLLASATIIITAVILQIIATILYPLKNALTQMSPNTALVLDIGLVIILLATAIIPPVAIIFKDYQIG